MKFTLTFLISIIVHLLILINLGVYEFRQPPKPQEKVFDVDIVQKEIPQIEPVVPEETPELTPVPSTDTGSPEIGQQTRGATSIPAKAMTLPEINIPKVTSVKDINITMPKLNVGTTATQGKEYSEQPLVSDINSSSTEKYHKSIVDTTGMESAGKKIGSADDIKQDFFVIKNMNGNRKLVYIPDKPVFSLSTNTAVRVQFKVDREGSTYSILLLNRTDSKIERLAIDFVQKLKFNAVLSDQSEPAEIILYFRVR